MSTLLAVTVALPAISTVLPFMNEHCREQQALFKYKDYFIPL